MGQENEWAVRGGWEEIGGGGFWDLIFDPIFGIITADFKQEKQFMARQKNKKFIEFLAKFIVESDAIESIEDDPDLVKKQLQANSKEGHVGALLLLESLAHEKEKALAEDIIREVQGLITAEQHTKPGGPLLPPEYIGRYRRVNVRIGGRIAPSYHDMPGLMLVWVKQVIMWQKTEGQPDISNLRQIARFHFEYEHIHPFADGNGRSGRAIVYYLMRHCGLTPFIFTAADRSATYYRCFQDPEAMCRYFEKASEDKTKLCK